VFLRLSWPADAVMMQLPARSMAYVAGIWKF
jgi:hypothetical protein